MEILSATDTNKNQDLPEIKLNSKALHTERMNTPAD